VFAVYYCGWSALLRTVQTCAARTPVTRVSANTDSSIAAAAAATAILIINLAFMVGGFVDL
jgi:hypothetical protein